MNIDEILRETEGLDYHERWKHMIKLGQEARCDERLTSTLRALSASPLHYARILALMSAHGSHDKVMIERFLEDPSSIGINSVFGLAARHLDAEALLNILPRLSLPKRKKLMCALARAQRETINDRFLVGLSPKEQLQGLAFASEYWLSQYIEKQGFEMLSPWHWYCFARRFPVSTKNMMLKALSSCQRISYVMRCALVSALNVLKKVAPKEGFELLKSASAWVALEELPLERYLPLFPEASAHFLLEEATWISLSWPIQTLRRLPANLLCRLVQKNTVFGIDASFPKLLREQRSALYQQHREAWRDETGAFPLAYVKALPRPLGEGEAMHAFSLPLLQSRAEERLPYLSVLPFPKALALLKPFLEQPDPALRALAVSALVEGGRYYPHYLDEILDFCLKRPNEPDPVRLAMMDALAYLPPTRWDFSHLPKLSDIIGATLKARDCSQQTMYFVSFLLLAMLPEHTVFVVQELPVLIERMGKVYGLSSSTYCDVPDEKLASLVAALSPLFSLWIKRDHPDWVVTLIQSFGRRARSSQEFLRLLTLITDDKRGAVARMGIETMFKVGFKKEAALRLPTLLKEDPSWIQVPCVREHLESYQQSLLTPFLSPQVYKGRFSSGNTRVLPPFSRYFYRWTAVQQETYAASLVGILQSPKRTAWELYSAVFRLSQMPSVDISVIKPWAALSVNDVALRDKAIEALGRVDSGRGVPVLLEMLDDERARVAIYALRRALLKMPLKSAYTLLLELKGNKITVIKEMIRLAGELQGEESYAFIKRFADDKNVHPDVEIALIRAFWNFLDKDAVWERFYAAAESGRTALARSSIAIPQDGLSKEEQQKLCRQKGLLLQHPDPQIRRETLERLVSMPLGILDHALFKVLLGLLGDEDPHVIRLATRALLSGFLPEKHEELLHAFSSLLKANTLSLVVDAYYEQKSSLPETLLPSAKALCYRLHERKWQIPLALRLSILMLSSEENRVFIQTLEKAGAVHPGVVEAGILAWQALSVDDYPLESLIPLEATLREAGVAGMRRLGLGLLCVLAGKQGWSTQFRSALSQYLSDPEYWVRDDAELIVLPPTLLA